MADNDLNDVVEEVVEDALVMTVNIDDTLTVSGEAADAKAVGDALALKADRSELSAAISVNGQTADDQGHIIVDASEIEMSASDTTTVKAAIEAASARTGADIPVSADVGADTIGTALSNLDAKAADGIRMSANDSTTIAQKFTAVESDMVKKSTDIVDDLTTESNTKALSAKQGKVLAGKFTWNLIDTKTGTDSVDVSGIDFNEILAVVTLAGGASSQIPIIIPRAFLDTTTKGFRAGYDLDATHGGYARVSASTLSLALAEAYQNFSDKTSTTTTTYYYR